MNETKTNQEFLLEVVKAAVDFNSNVLSIMTVELAGDQSGKNRTHRKKVLEDLRNMGYVYSANLDAMYTSRQTAIAGPLGHVEGDSDTMTALRKTKAFLDLRMASQPNRETADAANYLQDLIETEQTTEVEA